MLVDIYIIIIFFLALYRYKSLYFWPLVGVGFFFLEVYSLLPFGLEGGAVVLALLTVRIASSLFDASSYGARVLAFVIGIIAYDLSLAGMYYLIMRPNILEIFLRASLFLGHEFLLVVFVGITLYGVRFSAKLFSHAFLEEKIIF